MPKYYLDDLRRLNLQLKNLSESESEELTTAKKRVASPSTSSCKRQTSSSLKSNLSKNIFSTYNSLFIRLIVQ